MLILGVGLIGLGAVVGGLGQGLSFRAGLAGINANSPSDHRGEVASTFFAILYVAISPPVIGVGAAAQLFGLVPAGVAFAVIVAGLAAIALAALLTRKKAESR